MPAKSNDLANRKTVCHRNHVVVVWVYVVHKGMCSVCAKVMCVVCMGCDVTVVYLICVHAFVVCVCAYMYDASAVGRWYM